jgi:hypothetical protein
LSRYLNHGQVAIENNAMENAIRPTAIGKKNWLFVGHPRPANVPRFFTPSSSVANASRSDITGYLMKVLSIDTRVARDDQLAALNSARWKTSKLKLSGRF